MAELITFKSVWHPVDKVFDVTFDLNTKGRKWVERMTEDRYREFCKQLDEGIMKIGDWTVEFDDTTHRDMKQIKDYFKAVRDSYFIDKSQGRL